jgi:hypothetical protein
MATKLVPVLETTIAVAPPIVKAVGFSRLVPVMVTKLPTDPLEGVKDVMVGGGGGAVTALPLAGVVILTEVAPVLDNTMFCALYVPAIFAVAARRIRNVPLAVPFV